MKNKHPRGRAGQMLVTIIVEYVNKIQAFKLEIYIQWLTHPSI